jgi:hypothetical protein
MIAVTGSIDSVLLEIESLFVQGTSALEVFHVKW